MDKKPMLTFGSLFSGIGGLDLGFERAGFQVKWQVENNDYCTKVLAKHWPDVARYGDVHHVGKHNLEPVDCIIGGFPCQPHSQAGERKASSDERDLWPEFYRIIRELKPRWVVAENVLGLLSSEDGAFFGGILRDLAKARYDAEWRVLSAAQFGAPHLRERVILVAHATRTERQRDRDTWYWWDGPTNDSAIMAHTNSDGGRWAQRASAGSMACACRKNIERERHSQRNADQCSGSPLANTSGPEWWQSAEGWGNVTDWTNTGWEEAAGGSEFCGEELAHTTSTGCPERGDRSGIATSGKTLFDEPFDGSENMAYPSSTGRQEWDAATITGEQGHAAWRKIAPGTEQSSPWDAKSCLGGATSRIPGWLDGYHWPAGPGQEQYDWEAPRVTTEKVANRTARLKGLGNAVVVALAESVAHEIVAAEMAERQVVA